MPILNVKTIENLRDVLANEIEKLRNGSTTPANVNAITNASGKILSSVKLELEYNKMIGTTPSIAFIRSSEEQKKLTEGKKEKKK